MDKKTKHLGDQTCAIVRNAVLSRREMAALEQRSIDAYLRASHVR